MVGSSEYEIDGCKALSYEIQYEMSADMKAHMLQIIVDAPEQLYFFTFTQVNDEDYWDAFTACADSIRFE